MTNPALTHELLAELQRGYLANLPGRFDAAERLILQLEKSPDDRETFSDLFRQVHSLKGSAGTFGFHIVSWICHQLEDQLVLMDPANPTVGANQTTHLLDHIDLLRRTLPALTRGDKEFQEIEHELGRLKSKAAHFNFHCLFVDGSNLGRQICENALSGLKAQLAIEPNGLSALERLLREKFDVLISSNEVGRLSGIALIGAIKLTQGLNRDIKSILLTSHREIDAPPTLRPDLVIAKDANWPQRVRSNLEQAIAAKQR